METNLNLTINNLNLHFNQSIDIFKILISNFKNGNIDLNIYNETLKSIENIDFNKILKK